MRYFATCEPSSGGIGSRLNARDGDEQRAGDGDEEVRRDAGQRDDDVAPPDVAVVTWIHRHRLRAAEYDPAPPSDP